MKEDSGRKMELPAAVPRHAGHRKKLCPHKRQKSRCTDCGGSGICAHNRRRSQCTDCGGSQLCPHKRQKSQCIDCGGSQVCVKHKRLKRCCIFCPQAKDVCATHVQVLGGWNGRKCRKCEEKAPAARWMHTVYDPRSGNPVRHFYEDEEIAGAVARGEDPARVREKLLACRGRWLWKGRGW